MLHVDPNVLVPRPETETLVDWAQELLDGELAKRPAACVADLGTGSGAIALAVKAARPACQVVASDLSAAALAVARTNAARHRIELSFALGDWWSALPDGRFDLVLANPPYIDSDDAHLAALRHEPALALTPGADGLSSIRRIVEGAPPRVQAGGWLLLEHGHEQAEPVRALLRGAGFEAIATRRDLAGLPRCSGARRPH
jgi:release factor glutamine methyltransferase